ncbi:MAG: ABC transporter ATP-binding protein [Rhodobiaceae bacterium]|nr:ABC transporter ATP-binding protein [Rhodobiaceae bacterium]
MIVAFVLMGLVAATTGAYPLLIDKAYSLFETRNLKLIMLLPIAVIAVTAIKGASFFIQTVMTGAIVNAAVVRMQNALFDHLLKSDLAQLTARPVGTLITRFTNDLNLISTAFGRTITNSFRDILTVGALVISMFYLDWLLALIVLIVYPLAAIPIVEVGRRLRRVAKSTQVHMGDTTAFLNESLSGARMVKSYGLEDYERHRARGIFDRLYNLVMRRIKARARLDPLLEVMGGLAVAGVMMFGGYRISTGAGSIGSFTGFISALLIAAQPVRSIGQLNAAVQEGLAAAQRFYQLLDQKPKIVDDPSAPALAVDRGEIVFDAVAFAYAEIAPDGTEPEVAEAPAAIALNGVSFTVPAGKTVALVGPSGAGKSTVMNLIPRLFDADTGTIRIDGQDIRRVSVKSLRAVMALVSQDIVLFNDTVAANIGFGRAGASRDDIVEAAKAAAAHDFIMRLPEGYDTIVGDRGFRLSGGERQRLSIARAILKDAPILLLDEATSALDAESERQIQIALEHLTRDRTTLVIAHRLATVRNAHAICVMDAGRVVEQGTHDELVARGGIYAKLAALQFDGDKAPAAEA